MSKIAVIRVRGNIDISDNLRETFKHLNLHKKNWCVILEDTPDNMGQVRKVKDYVTWGPVNDEFIQEILDKRGEPAEEKAFEFKKKKYKRYIRLNPPKKGFGRKGVKVGFKKGGSLGDRGEMIVDLIKRMI